MAVEEPDNPMLRLLREIRETQDQQTAVPGEHTKQFDGLRRGIHDWRETTATAVGFASHADIRIETLQKQVDALSERLDRLERQH